MAGTPKTDESIFASAEYFKDVKPEDVVPTGLDATAGTAQTLKTKVEELLFMDANDICGTTMAFMRKDIDNLA